MYDSKRIAGGVGVLLTLWALVGLLVLSSGVGVSAQLTATGGFNISADYLGASNQSAVPTTTSNGAPAFLFRVRETKATNLYVNKTLDADGVGDLMGRFKVSLNAKTAYISEAQFKSDFIAADQATVRGLVIDDRYAGGQNGPISEKFLLYSGPNPYSQLSTDDEIHIGASTPGAVNRTERAALQLDGDVRVKASTLSAQTVRVPRQQKGLQLRVLYDPDDDGVYEYGT